MSKIMVVNAGSSSLKFMLLDMSNEDVICEGLVERIGIKGSVFTMKVNGEKKSETLDIKNHDEAVKKLLVELVERKAVSSLEEIDACGHRLVHGGEVFKEAMKITKETLKVAEDLSSLAPLHNPANIQGYKTFKEALKGVEHVAVADTSFHQTMKPEYFMYPIPYEWYEKHKVRRYGFHGTSHMYVSQMAKELTKNKKAKVIVAHIGNGASISAVDENGECVATSMGFTPLAGVMMGTRSGDVDPAIVTYMSEQLKVKAEEVVDMLNKKSGYLGLSCISSDARDVDDAAAEGNEKAILARQVMARRIADYIAQYYVALNKADVIAFTAGAGENDGDIRGMVMDRLKALDIEYDKELNKTRGKITEISTKKSKIKVFIIPTNEEIVIARETKRVLGL